MVKYIDADLVIRSVYESQPKGRSVLTPDGRLKLADTAENLASLITTQNRLYMYQAEGHDLKLLGCLNLDSHGRCS